MELDKMTLKAWRVDKKITATDAAKIAGVTRKTIYLWENEPNRLKAANLDSILKLCAAYDIKVENIKM